MAYLGEYKTWVQKQVKVNNDLVILDVVSNMQQGSILGLQNICEMQSKHGMAMDANEVHMARIKYVQE